MGYDISTSKYKQLETLLNKNTFAAQNIQVTNNEVSQATQEFEPKAKRVLYLFLSDGIQDIKGVEHEPIRCLVTVKQISLFLILGSTDQISLADASF